jgi:endonuclease/exonuclease/phosphatase family metal-dependent hydrolase
MTFNIQSGLRGLDGIAKAIRDAGPDLVALQEVDSRSTRSHGLDQAERLAELTGLAYHAHFRATDYYGGAYGVAVLSRFPLVQVRHQALPTPDDLEPRTVATAVVDAPNGQLSLYITHLTHLPTRAEVRTGQIKAIQALMAKDARPKLLLGDLNDTDDSEAVTILSKAMTDVFAKKGEGPGGTFPLPMFLPEVRIDYVFASPELAPLKSFVLRVDASDHYPLVAGFARSATSG